MREGSRAYASSFRGISYNSLINLSKHWKIYLWEIICFLVYIRLFPSNFFINKFLVFIYISFEEGYIEPVLIAEPISVPEFIWVIFSLLLVDECSEISVAIRAKIIVSIPIVGLCSLNIFLLSVDGLPVDAADKMHLSNIIYLLFLLLKLLLIYLIFFILIFKLNKILLPI